MKANGQSPPQSLDELTDAEVLTKFFELRNRRRTSQQTLGKEQEFDQLVARIARDQLYLQATPPASSFLEFWRREVPTQPEQGEARRAHGELLTDFPALRDARVWPEKLEPLMMAKELTTLQKASVVQQITAAVAAKKRVTKTLVKTWVKETRATAINATPPTIGKGENTPPSDQPVDDGPATASAGNDGGGNEAVKPHIGKVDLEDGVEGGTKSGAKSECIGAHTEGGGIVDRDGTLDGGAGEMTGDLAAAGEGTGKISDVKDEIGAVKGSPDESIQDAAAQNGAHAVVDPTSAIIQESGTTSAAGNDPQLTIAAGDVVDATQGGQESRSGPIMETSAAGSAKGNAVQDQPAGVAVEAKDVVGENNSEGETQEEVAAPISEKSKSQDDDTAHSLAGESELAETNAEIDALPLQEKFTAPNELPLEFYGPGAPDYYYGFKRTGTRYGIPMIGVRVARPPVKPVASREVAHTRRNRGWWVNKALATASVLAVLVSIPLSGWVARAHSAGLEEMLRVATERKGPPFQESILPPTPLAEEPAKVPAREPTVASVRPGLPAKPVRAEPAAAPHPPSIHRPTSIEPFRPGQLAENEIDVPSRFDTVDLSDQPVPVRVSPAAKSPIKSRGKQPTHRRSAGASAA